MLKVDTARIILLGLVVDVIYQLAVLNMFYPVEALVIVFVLAFIPYLLIRRPTTRIAHRWRANGSRLTAGEPSAERPASLRAPATPDKMQFVRPFPQQQNSLYCRVAEFEE